MASVAQDVVELIAAQLTGGSNSASATFISPTIAITTDDAVEAVGEVELRGMARSLHATVAGRDAVEKFAVLRVTEPMADLPADLLSTDPPSSNAAWTSAVLLQGHTRFGGVGIAEVTIGGHVFYRLTEQASMNSLTGGAPVDSAFARGAPVVVDNRVIGIIARRDAEQWLVVPIARMAASDRTSIVGDLLPLDAAAFFGQLSPSSRTALGVAAALHQQTGQDRVHMEHLILGLYAKKDGPTEHLVTAAKMTAEDLRSAIREAVEVDLPPLPATPPPTLTSLPPSSDHVRDAFVAARNIARVKRSPQVQSRHLLYGALSIEDCRVIRKLLEHNLRKEAITLSDAAQAARALAIAGYRSDEVGGRDLLDISKEVEALCMVLAAKDVEPPLSLGLFGDWGSGKSFFMASMEAWFAQLLAMSEDARKTSPYCSSIVQLKFNAWHYSDTNLWATLTSAILQGLADAVADNRDPDQRLVLRTKKTQAEQRLATAEEDVRVNQAAIESAGNQLAQLETPPARTIASVAADDPALQQELAAARSALRIPELTAAGSDVIEQVLAAKDIWQQLSLTLRNAPSRRTFLLAALALGGLIVGIPVAYWLATTYGLGARVGALALTLSGVAAAIGKIVAPVGQALKRIRHVQEAATERHRAANATAISDIKNDVEKRRTAVGAARDAATAAQREIAEVDAQLNDFKPEQRMAAFLKRRSESTDYLTDLGTISRARKDFEQLTALLAEAHNQAKGDDAKDDEPVLPRIDRIILYIDDLDRCPENKVVDVLQAVHLLLAFKLFVVVVGVDPRWLLHSLKQHSTAFQPPKNDGAAVPPDEQSHWESTPLNYLEKIFQIPFTLRPMGSTGFGQLVDYLTSPIDGNGAAPASDAPASRPPEPETATAAAARAPAPPPNAGAAPPARGAVPASPAAPAAAPPAPSTRVPAAAAVSRVTTPPNVPLNPVALRIEDREIAFMKTLHELIPSPRAAKRFVNVYRLLRTSVDEKDWKAFVGDGTRGLHRPVLLLLAMLMGYPEETTEVLRAIIDGHLPAETAPVNRTLRALLAEFRTLRVPATVPPDGEGWSELLQKVARATTKMPEDYACADLRPLAKIVARFSFRSGRILLTADTAAA
jgi:KAP-like P-loop domain-containing protein